MLIFLVIITYVPSISLFLPRVAGHVTANKPSMSWNPDQYLKFAAPRLRPAIDLLAHVPSADPRTVFDLGCGAGNVTQFLAMRWPQAVDHRRRRFANDAGQGCCCTASGHLGAGEPGVLARSGRRRT